MLNRNTCFALGVVCAVVLLFDSGAVQAAEADRVPLGTYEAARVFEELPVDGAYRLTPYGEGFLVLDRFNHRLLELSASGSKVRQFGQVGQGPGELRFPMDYAVGSAGTIRVVAPMGQFAIHSYSPGGEFLGVVRQGTGGDEAWTSYSIAVDSRDRYYLNQPRQGALLTRYSVSGERDASVGELLNPADVFEGCDQLSRCRDRRFAVRLNRVVTTMAPGDSIVAAFTAAPIVRRYAANGDLEFETRLRGDLIDELVNVSMGNRESWTPYITMSMETDGINALTLLHDVSVDPGTDLIYCLVGGRELYVLSPAGEQLAILTQDGSNAGFGSVAVEQGVAWLAGYSKLYRAELPRPGRSASP